MRVDCKREVEVLDGPYAPVNPEYGGPEYQNEKIAKQEGVGNILAEGVKAAAKKFRRGSERYAKRTTIHARQLQPKRLGQVLN